MGSLSPLENTGAHVWNARPGDTRPKTVVVTGVARSGTSMIAHILSGLGVFMGERADKVVMEDIDLARLSEAALKETVSNKADAELAALVASRNADHDLWGWKRPYLHKSLSAFTPSLRNPYVIVPVRDPMSIAMRNAISVDLEITKGLRKAAEETVELMDFIAQCRLPLLALSYEKAVLKPRYAVATIAEFLNIELSNPQLKTIAASVTANPKKYLTFARNRSTKGQVDRVTPKGELLGWAVARDHFQPLTLTVFVNGRDVGTVVADTFRPDLERNGMGTGHHGFRFQLPAELKAGRSHLIEVRVADNDEIVDAFTWRADTSAGKSKP